MTKREAIAAFRDPALAHDDALLATPERFADDGPFLETDAFHLRRSETSLPPMPFKIDLHTHTFFSGDGVSSPEENIAAARAKGLHGFAVTDHNTCDAVTYLLDKGLMREDGLPVDDFLIIPGSRSHDRGRSSALHRHDPARSERHARRAKSARSFTSAAGSPFRHILTICFAPGFVSRSSRRCRSTPSKSFNAATTLRRYNSLCLQVCAGPRPAHDRGERCASLRRARDGLHDLEHGRFLGERNARADLQEQRAEPALHHARATACGRPGTTGCASAAARSCPSKKPSSSTSITSGRFLERICRAFR